MKQLLKHLSCRACTDKAKIATVAPHVLILKAYKKSEDLTIIFQWKLPVCLLKDWSGNAWAIKLRIYQAWHLQV